MPLTNTQIRYGGVTKTFHWLTALLILSLIVLGLVAEDLPYDTDAELARKAWMFSLHKTLGVLVFFVALARILWAVSQPKPGLLNADKKAESFLAELVHWLLYGALVIVPLSGWIGHAAASGFAPIWWPLGQNLPLVPKSTSVEHFFGAVHYFAGRVLIGAILLHMAGALKHHFIDRDSTLRRMLPGEAPVGPLPQASHSAAPVVAALAIWCAALGLAVATAQGADGAEPASPALAEVASDWQVQEGSIAISVTQFGSEVDGSFDDWTAAITFDDTQMIGVVGDVTATISIPSLTLGSVTKQALGADFFAADTFPTATFNAQIQHASDGYEAVGTLTIKDRSVPLTLPFGLAITDDTAEMRADVTLDRRDFGIGDNMPKEDSLAFAVAVAIRLTATRAAAGE
ncbi:cytochrome [Sulfitobacter sp. EhC04]|uniref:cytochrome b/b6 domain-containing protein n=1 Tax=Sulfitobacter sp. EhC04 TaxID=1849168 RepID=UPI0007F45BBD|nr:cytochrome b/b6 domain-containing protein [Sulfitobacter sp. EhC04]OAN78348.1 cytochrome [Sulfitobacter sp. EhC04]